LPEHPARTPVPDAIADFQGADGADDPRVSAICHSDAATKQFLPHGPASGERREN